MNKTVNLAGPELYDKCVELIATEYNRYFSNSALACTVLADYHNIPLKTVMQSSKRLDDPFYQSKRTLCARIRYVLMRLEKEGEIEKYNSSQWRKVKSHRRKKTKKKKTSK
ncbi:MAG TPA: hypothetical protein ENI23_15195 [bacterium]|nr:hypothetical protein [bacterium]